MDPNDETSWQEKVLEAAQQDYTAAMEVAVQSYHAQRWAAEYRYQQKLALLGESGYAVPSMLPGSPVQPAVTPHANLQPAVEHDVTLDDVEGAAPLLATAAAADTLDRRLYGVIEATKGPFTPAYLRKVCQDTQGIEATARDVHGVLARMVEMGTLETRTARVDGGKMLHFYQRANLGQPIERGIRKILGRQQRRRGGE